MSSKNAGMRSDPTTRGRRGEQPPRSGVVASVTTFGHFDDDDDDDLDGSDVDGGYYF